MGHRQRARITGLLALVVAAGCGRTVPDGSDVAISADAGSGDGSGGAAGAGGGSGGAGGSGAFGGAGGAGGVAGASGAGNTGGSPGQCGGATCAGCCDPSDTCRPGTETSACGASGVACLDCGALGFGCAKGACKGLPQPCGPSTCDGCCDANDQCHAGSSADACGVGAGACVDCVSLGQGCVAGACEGTTPPCGPSTCDGCCDASGTCQPGTSDGACGSYGAACAGCSAKAETCTQPGSYCAYFPPCGSSTCPAGCCDASGICQLGRSDGSCGSTGQSCLDCSASGKACAPNGYCYAGKHCGADTCAGCCTPSGDCLAGTSLGACGQYGAVCDDCGGKGEACQGSVCSSGSTCPAVYAGCSPDALTAPPVSGTSCSTAEIQDLGAACAGQQPGPSCKLQFQKLLSSNPACYGCMLQISGDDAYTRCLVPFLNKTCNHALTCAVACSNAACNGCAAGTPDTQCRDDVFSSGGACVAYSTGALCSEAALSGPGSFCGFSQYGSDVGKWIAAVGLHYCH